MPWGDQAAGPRNINTWYKPGDSSHILVRTGSQPRTAGPGKSITIYKRYFTFLKYNSQRNFEEFLASQEFKDAGNDKPADLSDKIPPAHPTHCELVEEWQK